MMIGLLAFAGGFAVVLAVYLVWQFTPKGWLTIVVNTLVGAPLVLNFVVDALSGFYLDFGHFLSDSTSMMIAIGLALFNVLRRFWSDTPALQGDEVR